MMKLLSYDISIILTSTMKVFEVHLSMFGLSYLTSREKRKGLVFFIVTEPDFDFLSVSCNTPLFEIYWSMFKVASPIISSGLFRSLS